MRGFPIISDQVEKRELKTILDGLEKIIGKGTDGAVVEMGCYVGTASLFIRRLLDEADPGRQFHVYDSFAGLPPKGSEDNSPAGLQFQTGALAASKQEFVTNFKKARLRVPVIHKGWFEGLASRDMPECVAFAFLDGDYYSSIASCLHLIEPRLAPGGMIIVDDYQSEALPGARKAVDAWLKDKDYALGVAHSLAVISARN